MARARPSSTLQITSRSRSRWRTGTSSRCHCARHSRTAPMNMLRGALMNLLILASTSAAAAVDADMAAALGTTLTPLGAQRAGNADKSIPEWIDRGPASDSVAVLGNDKPLVSIAVGNMDGYAERLTEGTKALMRKYPATYRID